jgi:hypothetical protein
MKGVGTDRATLLARRVPHDEVVLGRAYIIHARNGGVGVAVRERHLLGYRLHREKFGRHYLFVEYDWADDDHFGTAIPLRLLSDDPPVDDEGLLAWLADREAEHRDEVKAAWREVLGDLVDRE